MRVKKEEEEGGGTVYSKGKDGEVGRGEGGSEIARVRRKTRGQRRRGKHLQAKPSVSE